MRINLNRNTGPTQDEIDASCKIVSDARVARGLPRLLPTPVLVEAPEYRGVYDVYWPEVTGDLMITVTADGTEMGVEAITAAEYAPSGNF